MTEIETANAQDVTRLYELSINLVPSLEDTVEVAFEKIKGVITKNGGAITAESKPALIQLAYTMVKNIDSKNKKYNTAYFGWVKFNGAPEIVAQLKEVFDLETDILRYVIFKTVADSVIDATEVAQAIAGDKEAPIAGDDEEVDEAASEDEVIAVEADEDSEDTKAVDAAIDELVEEEEDK